MKIQSVLCNQCGASLNIEDTTNFLNCGYCGTKLKVKRSESEVRTEALSEIRDATRQMADDMRILKLQNEIHQLDRDWANRRESFAVHGKNGKTWYPDKDDVGIPAAGKAAGVVFICIFVGVALFIASAATRSGAPGFFALVPIGMAVFAILSFVGGNSTIKKMMSKFQTARTEYDARRSEIEAQIDELRKEG